MLAHLTGSGGLKIRRAVFEILLVAELVPGELISMPRPPSFAFGEGGRRFAPPGGRGKNNVLHGLETEKTQKSRKNLPSRAKINIFDNFTSHKTLNWANS